MSNTVRPKQIQPGTNGQILQTSGGIAVWGGTVSGFSGFSGTSGFSGFSGTNGSNGATGTSGFSGFSSAVAGPTGTSGFSGFSGTNGSNGATGTSGFSGFSGTNGSNGATGTSGFSGFSSGVAGPTGTSGFSGYSGISGYSGFSGTSGFSGITPSFGGNEQYVETTAGTVSSTGGTTLLTLLTLTTGTLTGTYWIEWSCEAGTTAANKNSEVVFSDGTTTINDQIFTCAVAGGYQACGGAYQQVFSAASKSYTIKYAAFTSGGGTTQIRNGRIRIWRAS